MKALLLLAMLLPAEQLMNYCWTPEPICVVGHPACMCDQFGMNCHWACID